MVVTPMVDTLALMAEEEATMVDILPLTAEEETSIMTGTQTPMVGAHLTEGPPTANILEQGLSH